MSKLLIPYGIRDESIIHISSVERGSHEDVTCPVCSGPLVARKGVHKRHHFSHATSANCDGELILHALGKRLLAERITVALDRRADLYVRWQCTACGEAHAANLLRRARHCYLERACGPYQPDVLLTDENDKPVGVLEVVVTHPPTSDALRFYRRQSISLATFAIKDGADLEQIAVAAQLSASSIDACLRKKCPRCKTPLHPRRVFVTDVPCWHCGQGMRVAFGEGAYSLDPSDLTSGEIAAARKAGAVINNRFSATLNRRYLANVCPYCERFWGRHYLFECKGNPSGWTCVLERSDCHVCNTSFDLQVSLLTTFPEA